MVNGTRTDYVLDGDTVVREMRDTNNDGVLDPIATYFNGMYKLDNTTGAIRWYIYDGLGSVLAEVDPSGVVTAGRKYDVYGLVRTGQAGISEHKFVGKLGHMSEDETGLIYMRARYMDPVLGKFTSEDPAGDGNNWYTYCENNSMNMVDTKGLFAGLDDDLYLETEKAGKDIHAGNSLINKINRIFDVVRRETGMSRQQFREFIHEIKRDAQMGAKEDLWFDPKTGDFFRRTGEGMEWLTNLFDWV